MTGLIWRRSSSCEGGACILVAHDDDEVLMRDSKDPDGPTLRFTRAEWEAFRLGVLDGDFAPDRLTPPLA